MRRRRAESGCQGGSQWAGERGPEGRSADYLSFEEACPECHGCCGRLRGPARAWHPSRPGPRWPSTHTWTESERAPATPTRANAGTAANHKSLDAGCQARMGRWVVTAPRLGLGEIADGRDVVGRIDHGSSSCASAARRSTHTRFVARGLAGDRWPSTLAWQGLGNAFYPGSALSWRLCVCSGPLSDMTLSRTDGRVLAGWLAGFGGWFRASIVGAGSWAVEGTRRRSGRVCAVVDFFHAWLHLARWVCSSDDANRPLLMMYIPR